MAPAPSAAGGRERESPTAASRHHRLPSRLGPGGRHDATGPKPAAAAAAANLPELGEQVWGLVLPTRPDGSDPVLLALQSELGPVEVYGADSQQLGLLTVGGESQEILGLPLRIADVMPASGLLIKRDPGVPFGVRRLCHHPAGGGGLSLIATRQLWAISESGRLHIAGLCNRNLVAFADELPKLGSSAITGAPHDAR